MVRDESRCHLNLPNDLVHHDRRDVADKDALVGYAAQVDRALVHGSHIGQA